MGAPTLRFELPRNSRLISLVCFGNLKPRLSGHGQSGQNAFAMRISATTPMTTSASDSATSATAARTFILESPPPSSREEQHGTKHLVPTSASAVMSR